MTSGSARMAQRARLQVSNPDTPRTWTFQFCHPQPCFSPFHSWFPRTPGLEQPIPPPTPLLPAQEEKWLSVVQTHPGFGELVPGMRDVLVLSKAGAVVTMSMLLHSSVEKNVMQLCTEFLHMGSCCRYCRCHVRWETFKCETLAKDPPVTRRVNNGADTQSSVTGKPLVML